MGLLFIGEGGEREGPWFDGCHSGGHSGGDCGHDDQCEWMVSARASGGDGGPLEV